MLVVLVDADLEAVVHDLDRLDLQFVFFFVVVGLRLRHRNADGRHIGVGLIETRRRFGGLDDARHVVGVGTRLLWARERDQTGTC